MKKLGLAALALFPLVAGCYAPPAYYARPGYVRGYGRPVVYGPRPVYVAPPRVRVYW